MLWYELLQTLIVIITYITGNKKIFSEVLYA